jgi:DNA repair exonuclease SbcCD nuclease subunit
MKKNNIEISTRRIYTLTDLHFGVRNNSLSWKSMMSNFFDWFISDIKDKGFDPNKDILVLLGDIFNSRESLNLMILDSVVDIFDRLNFEFPNGIYAIVGNHDTYYVDNNDVNTMSMLNRILSNFKSYNSPTILNINNNSCLFLPWITSFDDIHTILNEDNSDYLFCHMDINEMKYSSGIDIDKSVDINILNKYKHVYSGHIHIRQTNKNITYLGTPYQLDTGDIGNDKGYHYIDCEDNFKLHFIKNTISPEFKIVNIYKILNSSIDIVKSMIDNCYVEVVCDSLTYNNIDLLLFRRKLSEFGVNFLKMEFIENKDIIEDTETDINFSNFSFDVEDSSKNLLKLHKKTDNEITSIMDYFMGLYKNVKTNIK